MSNETNKFFPGYPSYILTSPFGMRFHPIDKVNKMHNGVDLVATADGEHGQVDKIKAHTGGTVEGVGYDKSAGNFINIRVSLDTVMVYYHLRDLPSLAAGDLVETGQVIGTMGMTGKATAKHLHFGIKKNGQWIDPEPYLDKDYPVEAPKEEPGIYGTVTCSALNIRAGAGTEYRIIGGLRKGARVRILETATLEDTVWGQTEKGWVCLTNYVELETVAEPEKPEKEPMENTCALEMPVLCRGCKGNTVKALQALLIGKGYKMVGPDGKIYGDDGSFGGATKNAVLRYQEDNKLPETGCADQATWTSLLGLG